MMEYLLNDVFGVRSKLIASYIERYSVDQAFKEALTDGNEVIVYGSSKQGKTSLILKNLSDTQYVKVECSPQTRSIDIYKSILRQLKITFIESNTAQETYEHGGKISAGFGIKIPLFGAGNVGAEVADKTASGTLIKENYIEYNLELAQDVSEILKNHSVKKFIILENFHYLPLEVQENFAYDLRVFQDQAVIFVILGIWREANRLVQFNGDLLDRITEIPVEPWLQEDFLKVIDKGSALLNVDFSLVKEKLIHGSFDSIGVIQELCKYCCLAANITRTSPTKVFITEDNLNEAIKKKADEYGVRHIRNFESFVDITRKTSNQSGKLSLAFPYYFIRLLLTTDFINIEQGILRSRLLDEIRNMHHRPDDVRSGDLGQFLHNITQHQISKKIQPPFVDYDRGGKIMKIIDSSLYFFLRHCDRDRILNDIQNPLIEAQSAGQTGDLFENNDGN